MIRIRRSAIATNDQDPPVRDRYRMIPIRRSAIATE
jgi:hypothetical protein